MNITEDVIRALDTKMDVVMAQMSACLQAVDSNIRMLGFRPDSEAAMQIRTPEQETGMEQRAAVLQCLLSCQATADGAAQTTGHLFRNNTAIDEARTAYGDIGLVPANAAKHTYEGNTASDKARVVMGNMDGASFNDFMK